MRGFTLVETLMAIALILLVLGVGYAFSFTYLRNQQLQVAAETVMGEMRRAQREAHAQTADNAHGVSVFTDRVVRFVGTSYASRVQTLDAATPFPASVAVTGTTEVVFPAGSLAPLAASTTTLTANELAIDITLTLYGRLELTERTIGL